MQIGLNLSLTGQFLASTAYSANGFNPALVADFIDESYQGEGVNTLTTLIDHNSATAGNATMTGGYGPELVTNGAFDGTGNVTGWTLEGTATNNNGVDVFDVTSGAGTNLLATDSTLTPTVGKVYEVKFDRLSGSSGTFATFGGNTTASSSVAQSETHYLTATSTAGLQLFSGGASERGVFDNISVREIPKVQWRPHNLLKYSEDLSTSFWSNTATTVTLNATSAPDGTTTANEIGHTSTSAQLLAPVTTVSGVQYTFSFFYKYVDHQWLRVYQDGSQDVWIDTLNNTVGTDNSTSGATITSFGDGWYLVEVVQTAPDTTLTSGFMLANADNSTTETSGTSIYIWGVHAYRSDLGGMADVPSAERVLPDATTYVRTAGRETTGVELVTNGTFDSDSDWTKPTGWAISDGTLSYEGTGSIYTKAYQNISLTVDSVYEIRFTISNLSGSSINLMTPNFSTLQETFTADGSYVRYITATDTNSDIGIQNNDATQTFDIDNISVKEIDVDPSTARYLPRIGHHVYNGSQWVNEGLLHESEARTNLVTYSEALGSGWSTTDATIPAADGTAPDGTVSAIKVTEAATTAFHFINFAVTLGAAAHTLSAYLKAAERTTASFFLSQGGNVGAEFDLSAGTVTSVTGTGNTATIQDVGNGWYRCAVTNDGGADLDDNVRIGVQDGALTSYAGDGTSGIYVWGVQLEAASTPSSYIPTNSGATVARAAETLTIEHENLPWPSPYVIGDELVTNGTFDTDSDWTKPTGYSISGGTASYDGTGAQYSKMYQVISTTEDSVYEVSFTVSNLSGSSINIGLGNDAGNTFIQKETITANGTYTFIFVHTNATGSAMIQNNDATQTFDIDNISVKEINPLAVSIAMDGRMTYADTGTFDTVVFLRHQEDANNRIRAKIDTDSTRIGRPAFQHESSGDDNYVLGANDAYSPDILVPFNISSRNGSTFVNGAVDGVALTANTTPTALPDLSATDLNLGYDFMGTIGTFRIWANDIGDDGLVEATA